MIKKSMLFVALFASCFIQAAFDILVKVKKYGQTNQHEQLVSFEGHRSCKTVILNDEGLQIKMDPRVIDKDRVSINFKLSRVNSDEYFYMPAPCVVCKRGIVVTMPFEDSKESLPSELSFVLVAKKD